MLRYFTETHELAAAPALFPFRRFCTRRSVVQISFLAADGAGSRKERHFAARNEI
jgi:hypothetical protein